MGRAGRCRSSSTSPASRSRDYVEVVAAARRRARRRRHRAQHLAARTSARAGSSSRSTRRPPARSRPPSGAATDLPLLVKLSPNVADIRPIARAIEDAGADALTAINTLSGIAVAPGRAAAAARQHLRRPVAARRSSRSRCGSSTRWPRSCTIPVVAIGGVTELADVLDFLAVGAVAVQVGTAIFADPTLPVRLVDELAAECRRAGSTSHRELDRHGPADASRRAVGEGRRIPAVSRAASDCRGVTTVSTAARRSAPGPPSPRGPRRSSARPGRSARATSCSRAAATGTPTSRSSRSSRTRPRRASCAASGRPHARGPDGAADWSTSSPARRPAA